MWIGLGLLLFWLFGCAPPLTGYDPASNRCREWSVKEQKYVGPFLENKRCEGKTRPEEVPDE